jgi:hypothetical protein
MRFRPLASQRGLAVEITAILVAKAMMLAALYTLFFSSAVPPSPSVVGRHLVGSPPGAER